HPGLMPPADPRDGELAHACLAGNDAWSIAGCAAVGTLARLGADPGLAHEADAVAAAYRAAFGAALSAAPSRPQRGRRRERAHGAIASPRPASPRTRSCRAACPPPDVDRARPAGCDSRR